MGNDGINMDFFNNYFNNSNDNYNKNKTLGSYFFSLPPKQFALLSALLGILLIGDLSVDEQNSLGNFLVGTGSVILTAAAQGQVIESNNNNDQMEEEIKMLKKQIIEIKKKLD